MNPSFRITAVTVACLLAASAWGQQQVTITGSIGERVVADAPYAITVVDRDALRNAGPQINLSEALVRVPGLMVANRSNYAQDLQITSRGYGARATFGVRGIRLVTDGIPASGPDGQGQVSQFDLAGAERIEVLRGPFSVLYGNSSGGVINLVTGPVKRNEAEGALDVGSFGLRQLRAGIATQLGGGLDLRVSAAAMQTDGFRPHSEAKRRLVNGRLGWQDGADTVTVLATVLSQPADDPLGLRREEFDANPLQTTPDATTYDTRKDLTHRQIGAAWKHRFGDGALREFNLMGYAGSRSVTQFLAINQGTQTPVRHGGAVIDFDRSFKGAEAKLRLGWGDLELQLGLAADDQSDDRQGYENWAAGTTPPPYGVIGNLRRDETNRARTTDAFAQAEWAAGAGVTVSGGVRTGRVKLSSEDRYFKTVGANTNGDDSGSVKYSYTNPVLGLRWEAAPGLNLHASLARGFESPTLNEILYRADGTSGLNLGLRPQTSRQVELGAKWRGGGLDADVALFRIATEDEIAVAINAQGRAAFQNAGRTLRRGVEFGGGWQGPAGVSARVAYTFLDATYRDAFITCTNLPCNAANPLNRAAVAAGNRIAGTQRHNGYAELAWASGVAGDFGVEVRGVSGTAVNDTNLDSTAKYAIGNLRWTYKIPVGGAVERVELLARVDNVTDKRYAGSVIVNESNRRFFEPGAPRNWLLGVRVVGGL